MCVTIGHLLECVLECVRGVRVVRVCVTIGHLVSTMSCLNDWNLGYSNPSKILVNDFVMYGFV